MARRCAAATHGRPLMSPGGRPCSKSPTSSGAMDQSIAPHAPTACPKATSKLCRPSNSAGQRRWAGISPGACGELEYRYHSCKNRHCPKCQTKPPHAGWHSTRAAPACPVFPRHLYAARRTAVRGPLSPAVPLQLALANLCCRLEGPGPSPHRPFRWTARLGSVLHTPGSRERAYHPHVHYLVPGGASCHRTGQQLSPRSAEWRVPVHALSTLFRGKFKALSTAGLLAPVPPQVWHKGWVTHCQPAGTGTEVLAYCAPSPASGCYDQQSPGEARRRARDLPRQGAHEPRVDTSEAVRRRVYSPLPPACAAQEIHQSPLLRHPILAVARFWRRAGTSWQPAPATTRPPRAATPGTVTRPLPPRRRPCTAGSAWQLVWLFLLVPHKRRPP